MSEKRRKYKLEEMAVGRTLYRLVLFKTRQPKTATIVAEIRSRLVGILRKKWEQQEERRDPYVAIWAVAGVFDLAVLYECPDYHPDLLRLGTLPGVMNSTEFPAYAWEWKAPDGSNRSSFRPPAEDAIVGTGLIRFRKDLVDSHGLNLETRFVEYCMERNAGRDAGLQYSLLGTLAWPEVIVLAPSRSVSGATRDILDATSIQLDDSPTSPRILQKTWSFLSFPHDTFDHENANAVWTNIRDEPILPANPAREGTDDPHVAIPIMYLDCPAAVWPEVSQAFLNEQSFPICDVVLGGDDLALRLCRPVAAAKTAGPVPTWGQFLTSVAKCRSDSFLSEMVRSTHIVISQQVARREIPNGKALSSEYAKAVEGEIRSARVELTQEETDLILSIGDPVGHLVVSAIYTFDAHLEDPIHSACCQDMIAFVQRLKERAIVVAHGRDNPAFLAEQARYLNSYVNAVLDGLEQRTLGSFLCVELPSVRPSPLDGGFQRLIGAYHGFFARLYSDMLPHVTTDWDGFVSIAGPTQSHYSVGGAVNIPMDAAHDPTKLWPLFHEVLHVAQNIEALLPYDKQLDLAMDWWGISSEKAERDRIRVFLEEAAADLLMFRAGFSGDFEMYQVAIERWKRRRLPDHRISAFLRRLLAVWAVARRLRPRPEAKERPIPQSREALEQAISDEAALDQFWTVVVPRLRRPGAEAYRTSVEKDVVSLLPLVFTVDEWLQPLVEPATTTNDLTINTAIRDVCEGRIVRGLARIDVVRLVACLASGKSVATAEQSLAGRGNVAWVLSLWHALADTTGEGKMEDGDDDTGNRTDCSPDH